MAQNGKIWYRYENSEMEADGKNAREQRFLANIFSFLPGWRGRSPLLLLHTCIYAVSIHKHQSFGNGVATCVCSLSNPAPVKKYLAPTKSPISVQKRVLEHIKMISGL